MKGALCLFVAACLGVVMGEAPYPPSGWKPQGALLVLPSRQEQGTYGPPPPTQYGPPPSEYGPPAKPEEKEPEVTDDAAEVNKTMERLRQKEGSETGVYYVLLPDGRLQRIQYTTAPIKEQQEDNQNYNQGNQQAFNYNQQSSNQKSFNAPNNPEYSRQYSQFQHQGFSAQQQFTPNRGGQASQAQSSRNQEGYPKEDPNEGNNEENEKPSKYEASIHFSDVQPITDPIYAHNPAPLVRILRRV